MPFPSAEMEEHYPYDGGDFYRDSDVVFRGISMAPPAPEDCPSGMDFALGSMSLLPPEPRLTSKGFASGGDSCHHPADDLLKGMCFGGGCETELPPMPLSLSGCFDRSGAFEIANDHFLADMGMLGKPQGIRPTASHYEPFTDSNHPPNLPTDSFFTLCATTVHVASMAPCQLGNHMLDFFSSQADTAVESSIAKVRHAKFAITVDAFSGGCKCTMKVRVYREGVASYAVEFQRRGGDCLAFNRVYQQAAQDLKSCFAAGQDLPEGMPQELPAPRGVAETRPLPPPETDETVAGGGDGQTQSLAPLLDMIGHGERPALQAEAAAALADIATRDKLAPALCIEEFFEASGRLLRTDVIEICYPVARALSSLARHPEALPHFQEDGPLLAVVGDMMESPATSLLVQRQLAELRSKLGGGVP